MGYRSSLRVEIEEELAKISEMKPGSDEHRIAVDSVAKLMASANELERIDADCEDKEAIRENDFKLKQQQAEDEKKDRLVKNILTAAGIVLPLAVTIWGTKVSLKFEEEGTVTTQMGRGFIQRLFPKK